MISNSIFFNSQQIELFATVSAEEVKLDTMTKQFLQYDVQLWINMFCLRIPVEISFPDDWITTRVWWFRLYKSSAAAAQRRRSCPGVNSVIESLLKVNTRRSHWSMMARTDGLLFRQVGPHYIYFNTFLLFSVELLWQQQVLKSASRYGAPFVSKIQVQE